MATDIYASARRPDGTIDYSKINYREAINANFAAEGQQPWFSDTTTPITPAAGFTMGANNQPVAPTGPVSLQKDMVNPLYAPGSPGLAALQKQYAPQISNIMQKIAAARQQSMAPQQMQPQRPPMIPQTAAPQMRPQAASPLANLAGYQNLPFNRPRAVMPPRIPGGDRFRSTMQNQYAPSTPGATTHAQLWQQLGLSPALAAQWGAQVPGAPGFPNQPSFLPRARVAPAGGQQGTAQPSPTDLAALQQLFNNGGMFSPGDSGP